jgi:hypothetical protein
MLETSLENRVKVRVRCRVVVAKMLNCPSKTKLEGTFELGRRHVTRAPAWVQVEGFGWEAI